MLTTAGFDTDTAVGGLTAWVAGVGAPARAPRFRAARHPGLAARRTIPASSIPPARYRRVRAFRRLGVITMRTDWLLATAGRAAQRLRNWLARGRRPPLSGLDKRLLSQRDTIRTVLDRKWRQDILLTAYRLGLDYGCLLAALRATGADPRPSLVLLAYSAALRPSALPAYPRRTGHRGGKPERPAGPGRLCAPTTQSWLSSPTGSPPTGFPFSPGHPPTSSTAAATGGQPQARHARP